MATPHKRGSRRPSTRLRRKVRTILMADLMCGGGGSTTGARKALEQRGFRVKLVAINHWDVAISTHTRNHPDATHLCQSVETVRPSAVVPQGRLDLLWASPTCFPAGTLILTERGFQPIETISVGTRVLTHRGRWMPVTRVMSSVNDTVRIHGHGHYGLETTADHPFYTSERKHRHRPINGCRYRFTNPSWVAAAHLADHYWATPTSVPSLPIPPVPGRGMIFTQQFWWFVGRWLGDGYFVRHTTRTDEIGVCSSHAQADGLAARLAFAPYVPAENMATTSTSTTHAVSLSHLIGLQRSPTPLFINGRLAYHDRDWFAHQYVHRGLNQPTIARLAGVTYRTIRRWSARHGLQKPRARSNQLRWHRHTASTTTTFTTAHLGLAAWLKEQFGEYAHGKRLPAWVFGMKESDRRALLSGYLSADGHYRPDLHKTFVTTVSRELAIGVRLLAESLGHRVSLHFRPARQHPQIEGRPINERPQYTLTWLDRRLHEYGHATQTHSWLRVRSVHTSRRSVPVFNLSVAEDESYIADGLTVHNCTFYSRARGGKPTSDQQRADPWHIIPWLTELRVRVLIVENVPEIVRWGPVNPSTGKPLKSRQGQYFQQWVNTIKGLGFQADWRILNAADFGEATTRHRFFLIARSDGTAPQWPDPTHAERPSTDPLFGTTRKPWRPAREIIDWRLRGASIFTRKKPLRPKTLLRIYTGIVRFGWPEPFVTKLRRYMLAHGVRADEIPQAPRSCRAGATALILNRHNGKHGEVRARPVTVPLPTATRDGAGYIVEPFVLNRAGDNGGVRAHSIDAPTPTATCRGAGYLVEPFIATVAHGNESREKNPHARRCRSLDDPLQTIHAGGGKFAVVEPFVLANRTHNTPKSLEKPTPPVLTGRHLALVEPASGWCADGGPAAVGRGDDSTPDPLVVVFRQHGDANCVEEPLPGITAGGRHAGVVEPIILSQGSGGAARTVGDPMPTVTSDGAHALIAPYYGQGSGETCRSVTSPLPTVTAKARFGLVLPLTHAGPGDRARDVDQDPLPTITSAHRGELAFITAGFGERERQTPRVHPVDEPAPTVRAQGHVALVQPGDDVDILFRMLHWRENAAAMGFIDTDLQYEFCGTATDIQRQIGNAVSVKQAAAIVGAQFEDY